MNAILEQINSAGLKFVEFALPMFVQSVVLIVILLLADFALRKKVRAVFRYWIWMLVLVKLVLPASLSSPMSLGYFFGDRLTYVETTDTPAEPQVSLAEPAPVNVPPPINLTDIEADRFKPTSQPTIPAAEPVVTNPADTPAISVTPLSWQGAVFLVWITVVIAMVLLLLQRVIFVKGLVAQAKEANGVMVDMLESCRSSMSVKRKLELKISANATSPAVCGLFRPVILVPQNLTSSLTTDQLSAVLLHELTHIRRGDLFVNLAQTVLQIIYFYNPLLWLANYIIRRIREQAVDEMVLVAMGEKAPQYPQTLVSVAKLAFKRPVLSLRLIGVVESKSALSTRIKHILNRPIPKKAKLGILGLVAVIITGAILLPMARGERELRNPVRLNENGSPIVTHTLYMWGQKEKPIYQLEGKTYRDVSMIVARIGQLMKQDPFPMIRVRTTTQFQRRQKPIESLSKLYRGIGFINMEYKYDLKQPPSPFRSTLPNGVTVELIGICEHPSEGKQWWRPDGSKLEQRPFEKLYSRVYTKREYYELALKIENPQNRKLSIIGKDGHVFNVHSGKIWGGYVLSEGKKILNQSIGIAHDPWETIVEANPKHMQLIGDFVFGVAFESDVEGIGTAVGVTVTHTIGKEKVDYRVIAVDWKNNIHTSLGHSRAGSDSWMQTTVHFKDLQIDEIKEFQFQTRPYQWVEFKNISLKPNFKTNVQVEKILTEENKTEKAGIYFPMKKISSIKNDKGGTFEWETSVVPAVRFHHGWYSIVDGGVVEHVGGGSSRNPEKGKLKLKLDVELKDNMFNIKMQREQDLFDGSKTASLRTKTTVPPGSYLKHSDSIDSAFLTNEHFTLWRGDFIRDSKVVKSVIYAAYLTTPDDKETDFMSPVLQKPEFTSAKDKTDVQIERETDWVIEDYGQTKLLSDKEKPETDNWVSVWGNMVKNKGRYLVPDKGLTLKDLIQATGYNRDKLAQSYVELIRRSQQGNITARSTYSRNLKTLLRGEESDVVIKSHDSIGGGYIEPSANGVEFWGGYHFSEVVELIINDDGAKVNMFADLDNGELITPPNTLDFDDENAVLRWIKENEIDVMGETAAGVHGLIGFNMYAARVDNYFWDAAPQEVTNRLMERIDEPVLLSVEDLLPVTYLIKTSEYKLGILQILDFVENPKGIKIRYKLLYKESTPKHDVQVKPEPVSGDWQYIGQSIPPDFNDTMILAEHVNLGSIGHDAEGKTFITLFRDREKTKGRQYRFVLFNKAGDILEPDGHLILGEDERLEEKFTFDEPFMTRRLKGFRFQARSLPPPGFDNISSILQKPIPEVVKDETLLPSSLAPPGRYAVELDGVDDYLLVPDSPSLRLEPPFTIEMWIKTKLPPDVSEYRGGWALISKGFTVGTPRAYLTGFGINLDRRPNESSKLCIDFCKANHSGTYAAMYTGYPLTNGVSEWIHITHVFKGDHYKSTPGHPLVMGKFLIPTNNPFRGLIGEVRLWNGARNRQELREYENVALTGTESGLAACWNFEQTKGKYACDISANNNHARLGKFTGPDDADPKWIDLQAPSPQSDQRTELQVEVEKKQMSSLWGDKVTDIKLPFTFTIYTLTPDGKSQPGVKIRCVHPRPERANPIVDMVVESDDKGVAKFTITKADLITDWIYWFSLADKNYVGSPHVGITPDEEEWTFKVLPAEEFEFQVIGDNGPVPKAKISLSVDHNKGEDWDPKRFRAYTKTRSDSTGRAKMRFVKDIVYMGIAAKGYASKTISGVELSSDKPYLIELDRGKKITGQVKDPNNNPLEGVSITAKKEEIFHYDEEFILKASTDENGKFILKNVTPGQWEVSARTEDPAKPYFIAPAKIKVRRWWPVRTIKMVAKEGFRLKGKYITNYKINIKGDGELPWIDVSVFEPDRAWMQLRTNEDGTFDIWGFPCEGEGSIDFVGGGGYYNFIKMPDEYNYFKVFGRRFNFKNVPPGTYENIEVHYLLAGLLNGTVVDAMGHSFSGAEIEVRPRGGLHKTDEEGKFAIRIPPVDNTTLIVRDLKTRAVVFRSEPFNVGEGEVIEKNIKARYEREI
ncbi:MAG: hypothetical protein GY845_10860 [Planctomycetes bacterium]|nr:hypothetical protein [Planctomycetota bacterium]